jgi:hypothetical protein
VANSLKEDRWRAARHATRLGADGMNVAVNYRVDREVVAAIEAGGSHA